MAGLDEMQRQLDEMLLEIQRHTDDAVAILSKSNIKPKQTGFLCENIFVIDLNSKEDFEKSKTLMEQLKESNKAIINIYSYDKPKRISLTF